MNASNNAPSQFRPKSVAPKDAPVIELSSPKLFAPVSSPTPIELKFQPTPPSAVKPETFKVLYGSFEIDITKRIMVVEDTYGRRGNKAIEFEVH